MRGYVSADKSEGIVGDNGVVVEVVVEYHRAQLYSARFHGLKRQNGMIDGAKTGVCHQHERQVARRNIVDGESAVIDWHHQAAGALDEHRIVSLEQPGGGAVDEGEVYVAAVEARGQLCRSRVCEYDGGRSTVEVFGQQVYAAEAAMGLDVLGSVIAACLYEFLRHHTAAAVHEPAGEEGRGIRFAGIGVDAAYKNGLFHFFLNRKRVGRYVIRYLPSRLHGNEARARRMATAPTPRPSELTPVALRCLNTSAGASNSMSTV